MTNYLRSYAHFTNKYDLDKAASQHEAHNWQSMNDTDRRVLHVIRRYSVKFGAAHLKHDTIATAIGKSNTTVRRAIRKLIQLEIIDKIHYVRPVMNGLGANIYAIKPYKVTPKVEPIPTKKSTPVPMPNLKTTEPEQISTTLFGRMKQLLTSTIGETTLARNFFGVYRKLTNPMLKFSIHEPKGTLFEQLAIQALHISVQATKRKSIRNLPGYYSGVLRKLIDEVLFEDAFMDYDVPVEGFYWREERYKLR